MSGLPGRLSRRRFVRFGAAGAAALFAPWRARGASRPNIVFILMDDMGAKDAACLGSDFYETPSIDRLAVQGVVFTQAYANAPNCAPSRASLMTGQYTPRHGIYTVGTSERGPAPRRRIIPVRNSTVLPADKITFVENLKGAGYSTFHAGKWHLGQGADTGPEGQGFDVNVGGGNAGSPPGGYFAPWNAPGLGDAPKGAHLCDYVTTQAVRFIESHKDGPFFVYLSYYDVHTPLQAKAELRAKYERKLAARQSRGSEAEHRNAVYAAMLENADTNIGRVLRALDDLRLADDTIVVFFSDNGGLLGVTSQLPLRGGKGMLYEGGIREPAIIRWPGRVRAGSRCDVPIMGVDFYPTFLEITGAGAPENQPLDGSSILPLLSGNGTLPQRPMFWHFPCYLEGGPEAQPDAPDPFWRNVPGGAVRLGDWKLIEYFDDGRLELYNLREDAGERNNLATSNPQKCGELHALMKGWRRSVRAPVPVESEPRYDPGARE